MITKGLYIFINVCGLAEYPNTILSPNFFKNIIKRPARDACLCMGDLQAPPAPAAPHLVFLITL